MLCPEPAVRVGSAAQEVPSIGDTDDMSGRSRRGLARDAMLLLGTERRSFGDERPTAGTGDAEWVGGPSPSGARGLALARPLRVIVIAVAATFALVTRAPESGPPVVGVQSPA